MPVFISYSHADRDFAENLALHLVQAKQNVWIDKWELNAGDSLISKIEEALGGADAILALLSKNSVESAWCKKELNSGLMRELEEKSVLIIPIILDDCQIPLFLKEKLLIDFRKDRDENFSFLLQSLNKISNPTQARAEMPNFHIDWGISLISSQAEDWGVEWTFVNHGESSPYVVLTQVVYLPTEGSKTFFSKLPNDTAKFVSASKFMKSFLDSESELLFRITSAEPIMRELVFVDEAHGGKAKIMITVRCLGEDNGMDTLVRVEDNIHCAVNHTLGAVRHPKT